MELSQYDYWSMALTLVRLTDKTSSAGKTRDPNSECRREPEPQAFERH
jgi:hypothetical protein